VAKEEEEKASAVRGTYGCDVVSDSKSFESTPLVLNPHTLEHCPVSDSKHKPVIKSRVSNRGNPAAINAITSGLFSIVDQGKLASLQGSDSVGAKDHVIAPPLTTKKAKRTPLIMHPPGFGSQPAVAPTELESHLLQWAFLIVGVFAHVYSLIVCTFAKTERKKNTKRQGKVGWQGRWLLVAFLAYPRVLVNARASKQLVVIEQLVKETEHYLPQAIEQQREDSKKSASDAARGLTPTAHGGLIVTRRMTTVTTENEFRAALANSVVIELAADITLAAQIVISGFTGLTMNGNSFKVDGNNAVMCFYITNCPDMSINHFTITKGFNSNAHKNGGGLYILDSAATISY
jgi:hypothetical protein